MISIVDDDESVRESTSSLVRSLGYRTAAFPSAEAFLNSGSLEETSCVITDIQMAGLSGVDLQDRLAAAGCTVPIIFITAFPDERTQFHVLQAGAAGYLTKPFSDEHLIACLESALSH